MGGTAAAWVGVLSPDEPNTGYCSPLPTLDRDVWMHNGFGTEDLPGLLVARLARSLQP